MRPVGSVPVLTPPRAVIRQAPIPPSTSLSELPDPCIDRGSDRDPSAGRRSAVSFACGPAVPLSPTDDNESEAEECQTFSG